jgi:hypothetical protein
MPLNKTFLLAAVAPHTEGSMLLVIDSLDDFVVKFKEYYAKKREFMLAGVPKYYAHKRDEEWGKTCDKRTKLEKKFIADNNNKPFDFEFETGCRYSKDDTVIAGYFYDNVNIFLEKKRCTDHRDDCHWYIVREFMSDLPTGTHYLGDYCA